jgi:hypothetical protein
MRTRGLTGLSLAALGIEVHDEASHTLRDTALMPK